MDLEPDPVAETVPECPCEVGLVDHATRGRVGIDARHSGSDRLEPFALGLRADAICRLQLVRKRTRRERAGVVGAVTVDRAARVDDDGLSPLDHPVGRARMRLRGVRARRDDRLETEE